MAMILPPGLTEAALRSAIREFTDVLGADRVLFEDEDRIAYSDKFAVNDDAHPSLGGLAPETVEEVQAVVRIANKHKVPLWPISRGKNLGYGSSAPLMRGTVMLDLSRMRKIEVDPEGGTVLVEPGVGFYDLYDYLKANDIKLWLSVPGNSWGSVAGNALDRGAGYTTYGDHSSRICGLEVVLPEGDLVRTGMGAMADSPNWQLYRNGFGPGWDQMFCQSNFGIVTKLGLWLMPEPESMLALDMEFDKAEDLGWVIDTLGPLRREGILLQSPSIGNWLRTAATLTTRKEWTDKPGTLDESVITAIRRKFNIGWWSLSMRFYGPLEITTATRNVVKKAFDGRPVLSQREGGWKRGDPPEMSAWAGVPVTFPMQNVNWHGGRGAHIGYSPVMPMSGKLAMEQYRRTRARFDEFGIDYHPSFTLQERSILNINQVLFNKDDPDMLARVDKFFRALVKDATEQRYGEYRTHLDYMDLVADTYDFNDHALRRLNQRVKNALDPNGIIAPGKSGIWPTRYQKERLS